MVSTGTGSNLNDIGFNQPYPKKYKGMPYNQKQILTPKTLITNHNEHIQYHQNEVNQMIPINPQWIISNLANIATM